MKRRQFLTGILGTAAGGLTLPAFSQGLAQYSTNLRTGERRLNLYRPETKERLDLVYLRDGVWVPGVYEKICWFLRDQQANVAVQMSTDLIALLDWIHEYLRQYSFTGPIHIISGYRTAETNKKIKGAATHSQHLAGTAADIHIPGLDVAYLGKLVKWLQVGGVGVYVNKNTVHIDAGPVRSW